MVLIAGQELSARSSWSRINSLRLRYAHTVVDGSTQGKVPAALPVSSSLCCWQIWLTPRRLLLGQPPKEFFLQILPSIPTRRVLGYELVWLAVLHTMVVPPGILYSSNRGAVRNTPHNARLSKVGQEYQISLGNSHFQPVLPFIPTTYATLVRQSHNG